MVRMMFKALAKKLFGKKYEGLKKAPAVCLIMFLSLHVSGFRIYIAPLMRYLMTGSFTAGVMWRALHSEDNAANMKNLLMLPFHGKKFIFTYVSALGTYTVLTKTAVLLAVVLAVSPWKSTELLGCLLCMINAVLVTAFVHSYKKCRSLGFAWAGIAAAGIFLLWDLPAFLFVMTGDILLTALFLAGADPYAFFPESSAGRRTVRSGKRCFMWRYLFRYYLFRKNYMMNTAVMWGIACVLPVFLGQMKNLSVMPVGFAILTLNTPICILLSGDPALEQAIRFLPGQKRAFGIPYCLFIFLCNMTVDVIFLCSWQIQIGGVTAAAVLTAVLFALQSAVGSVLLEWFFPIRGWKIENDLWHHPRKYIIPAAMLLLAAAVGTMPAIIPVLAALVLAEGLFLICADNISHYSE